jgi:hypothetical protein
VRLVGELDKRRTKAEAGAMKGKQAQGCASSGKSAETTAEIIGVSTRKIEQARAVLDKAAPEVKAAVVSGDMTINKAYQETRTKASGKIKTPAQEEAFYEKRAKEAAAAQQSARACEGHEECGRNKDRLTDQQSARACEGHEECGRNKDRLTDQQSARACEGHGYRAIRIRRVYPAIRARVRGARWHPGTPKNQTETKQRPNRDQHGPGPCWSFSCLKCRKRKRASVFLVFGVGFVFVIVWGFYQQNTP